MIDRDTFLHRWHAEKAIGVGVFKKCDTDQNGFITPDEAPCRLPYKSMKIKESGNDLQNTSGCELPVGKGDVNKEMDKFMECMMYRK